MATKSAFTSFTSTSTSSSKPIMTQKFKKKKKTSSSLNNIKIKPFSKPPSLPPNFYNVTTTVLFNSLRDILHQRNTNNISREELYNKVTDLCRHGFGPKLYLELVNVLDDAAKVCLSRLVGDEDARENDDGNTICYPTPHCFQEHNNFIYFKSVQEIDIESKNNVAMTTSSNTSAPSCSSTKVVASDEDNLLLGNIWKVYSDYVQYLNCVRLIFQSLDRMFLYLPPSIMTATSAEREARVVARSDGLSGKNSDCTSGGISLGTWNMWDVGINCIYKHMANMNKKEKDNKMDCDTVMESTDAVVGVVGSAAASDSSSASNKTYFSTLDVLKQRTTACLIEELKVSSPSSSLAPTKSTELFHQIIVRNCILIFRSFTNVSTHPSNAVTKHQDTKIPQSKVVTMSVMDTFLQALVAATTSFFKKESISFMQLEESTIGNTTEVSALKSSYDTRFILHYVDSRLKQVNGMTTYYTLSTPTWSSSNKDNYLNKPQEGYSGDSTRNDNKILSRLVETHLLSPHFTTKYILHPGNLHPILDDEDDQQLGDVKLLFQLSKRVHTNNDSSSLHDNNANAVPYSPGMELLRISFEHYARDRGLSIMRPNVSPIVNIAPVSGPVKPPPQLTARDIQNQIVSNLLKFKAHIEHMIKDAFASDEYFVKTVRKVLEDVLNQGGQVDNSQQHDVMSTTNRRKKNSFGQSSDGCDGGKRIAELLAKYIDLRFKNAKAILSSSPVKGVRTEIDVNIEDDMEAFQNAVLDLFRYIQSKDVFEAFYRRDLSKRLLSNKSASIDDERLFVSKLKGECGTGYTSKMEGMFKDMELSRDVMANYSAYLGGLEDVSSGSYSNLSGTDIGMDIQVLTTGYWPVQTKYPSLILPDSLEARKNHFESYYLSKYQGRRISWQNSLGSCNVRAHFPKVGQRDLNVSLLQALVLMCFNVDEGSDVDPALTIIDVMKKTGIEDRGEAERVLQSLSMGRDGTQVLRRVEDTNESNEASLTPKKKHKISRKAISDTDVFMFNADFFTTQRRIRITNIQMKETPEENAKTQESVTVDRLYLIDAAIVRTMKARKTLDHRTLLGEVMKQLKFPASGTDIKKQIEKLIDREYMERVDSTSYNYLA